jgi:putative FmdB family regulatory protein
MPTYEYECTSCGQHIEVFQRISEDPLTTCGVCGGNLRKVFHPAGIVFKGSGFYATDSRSASKAEKQKAEATASSGSGEGSSSGSEGSSASSSSRDGKSSTSSGSDSGSGSKKEASTS